MQRRPPRPTRTDTLFPATTFCRSPGAVHSSRHGCIHQIISGCHIAEDAADHAGLFTGVHIAIAEGCCFTHALSSSQVLQPPQRLLSPFLMPELPEVETTIAGLRPVLEGQVLTSVEPRRADLRWPIPLDLRQRLTGATVTGLSRRAKYGLIAMDRGDTLIFHLGMSGRWRIDPQSIGTHDHRSEEYTSELQTLMDIHN